MERMLIFKIFVVWFVGFTTFVEAQYYEYCDAHGRCPQTYYTNRYVSLHQCYYRNYHAFLTCYQNIQVGVNRREDRLSDEEFENYKCMLINSLMNCLELKTEIFCSHQDLNTARMITRMVRLEDESECNGTGVVASHLLQFSI